MLEVQGGLALMVSTFQLQNLERPLPPQNSSFCILKKRHVSVIQENSSCFVALLYFRRTGHVTDVDTTGKSAHARASYLDCCPFYPIKIVLGKCFSANILYVWL